MKKKKILKLRWKFLFILLLITIIPIIIISYFTFKNIFNHLINQNKMFYSRLLKIVSNNFDFIYEQYGRSFFTIFNFDTIKKGLLHPQYKSISEENEISEMICGNENITGLRNFVRERIEGAVFLYELDKKSLINNTNYKIHYGFNPAHYISPPDFNKMISDPLFLKIKNNNKIKLIFGKFQKGTIPGFDGDNKSVFIYPYYPHPPINYKETFNKFLIVLLNKDFINNLYLEIDEINYGTLYIIDELNNIITKNHPSNNDYFDYDDSIKQYKSSGTDDFDFYYNMSFQDYKVLNTDENIIKLPAVNKILNILTEEKIRKEREKNKENIFNKLNIIRYNNIDYLFIFEYSEITNIRFLFFFPLTQILKPIYNLLKILSIITLLIVIIIILLSIFISKKITKPINQLAETSLKIGEGNYNQIINLNSNDEIGILCSNFNIMITNLNEYKEKLIEDEIKILNTQNVTIKALAQLAEYRDESTGKHLERVKEYVKLICILLRNYKKYENYLTDRYITDISNSSYLHDIGKVGIETSILRKPDKLTAEEFEIIKKHTIIGGDALSKADKELGVKSFLTLAKEICYYHHEKYDGTGYPKQLIGDQIPLSARITSLADVYDALTQDRCYRKALTHNHAIEIIIEKDKGHFDPEILECFKENHIKFCEIKNSLLD